MTSPQVSEQEVEAIGRAIGARAVDLAPGKLRVEWPWLYDPDSNTAVDLRELVRAGLTAAAQVRERADSEVERMAFCQGFWAFCGPSNPAEHDALDIQEDQAWAAYVAARERAAGTGTLEQTQRSRDTGEEMRESQKAGALRLPTEPDSGPDVLGERQGEE